MAITAEARKATQTRATLMPMSAQIVGAGEQAAPGGEHRLGRGQELRLHQPRPVDRGPGEEHDHEGAGADPELDARVRPARRRRTGRATVRGAVRSSGRRALPRRLGATADAAMPGLVATWLITETVDVVLRDSLIVEEPNSRLRSIASRNTS